MTNLAFREAPAERADLANWRQFPFSAHGFLNVDSIIPVAAIKAGTSKALEAGTGLAIADIKAKTAQGALTVGAIFHQHNTQGLVVLHRGKRIAEQYGMGHSPASRHIVFSVSKSITALLAGILVGEGKLDPEVPVVSLMPQAKGSAYADCTVRHILDMQVSIVFKEDYADTQGDLARYRVATGYNPPGMVKFDGGTRDFVLSLPKAAHAHGETFHYVSPNSDLLGQILEKVSGQRFANLLSDRIWQPMGAEADAFITVDKFGDPRTAGGICMRVADMARLGELVRNEGRANGKQIVPKSWIDDIKSNGSREAWKRGSLAQGGFLPEGHYRSKWYAFDDADGCLAAIGIHGQWIYINPKREVVIARQSCQPVADDLGVDHQIIAAFKAIAEAV
jgi:CubicO group peptidase (beta-lactamase class C family)